MNFTSHGRLTKSQMTNVATVKSIKYNKFQQIAFAGKTIKNKRGKNIKNHQTEETKNKHEHATGECARL